MLWALVKNKKNEAIPNTIGKCPLCMNPVHSKCGEIYNWHWAHSNKENCDPWYEGETDWHYHWKMTFGKENSEVTIRKEEAIHRADIQTINNVIIELQNSSISQTEILKRETFYGERMLWIINGKPFERSFTVGGIYHSVSPIDNMNKILGFYWRRPRSSWERARRNVFIDFGADSLFWVKEGMGNSFGKGKYVSKKDFILKYGGDFSYYHEYK